VRPLLAVGLFFALFAFASPAVAQTTRPPAAPPGAGASAAAQAQAAAPMPYGAFVQGATVQDGLIQILRKGGKVFLALSPDQLGKDFIQTAVPSTGLGGLGPAPGEPYVAPRASYASNAFKIRSCCAGRTPTRKCSRTRPKKWAVPYILLTMLTTHAGAAVAVCGQCIK